MNNYPCLSRIKGYISTASGSPILFPCYFSSYGHLIRHNVLPQKETELLPLHSYTAALSHPPLTEGFFTLGNFLHSFFGHALSRLKQASHQFNPEGGQHSHDRRMTDLQGLGRITATRKNPNLFSYRSESMSYAIREDVASSHESCVGSEKQTKKSDEK